MLLLKKESVQEMFKDYDYYKTNASTLNETKASINVTENTRDPKYKLPTETFIGIEG